MQAIVYHRYGSPDVLELEEIPKPTPAEGQVLIRVHAAHQKCTPTYASGFDPYSTVFSSGNSYTFATSAFAPILIAGLSSKQSARASDSAMTSAPSNSANGNTGKIAVRQLDKKGWPSEAKIEMANRLRPSFPVQARFWPKPDILNGSKTPGPIRTHCT